jgi:hypothetical protein
VTRVFIAGWCHSWALRHRTASTHLDQHVSAAANQLQLRDLHPPRTAPARRSARPFRDSSSGLLQGFPSRSSPTSRVKARSTALSSHCMWLHYPGACVRPGGLAGRHTRSSTTLAAPWPTTAQSCGGLAGDPPALFCSPTAPLTSPGGDPLYPVPCERSRDSQCYA